MFFSVSFCFLRFSKSVFFLGLNFVSISHNICLKKQFFGLSQEDSFEASFPLFFFVFLCFFFVFLYFSSFSSFSLFFLFVLVFHCFSMFFFFLFVFLCFSCSFLCFSFVFLLFLFCFSLFFFVLRSWGGGVGGPRFRRGARHRAHKGVNSQGEGQRDPGQHQRCKRNPRLLIPEQHGTRRLRLHVDTSRRGQLGAGARIAS